MPRPYIATLVWALLFLACLVILELSQKSLDGLGEPKFRAPQWLVRVCLLLVHVSTLVVFVRAMGIL